jgi:hypothetical protein
VLGQRQVRAGLFVVCAIDVHQPVAAKNSICVYFSGRLQMNSSTSGFRGSRAARVRSNTSKGR